MKPLPATENASMPPPAPPWRLQLAGLALGVVLALIVAPTTRWLVAAQVVASADPQRSVESTARSLGLRDVAGPPPSADRVRRNQQNLDRAAVRAPDDYPVQLAAALSQNDGREQARRLRTLQSRFGDNPSLYANLLRVMCRGEMTIWRDEDYLLTGDALPKGRAQGRRPSPSSEALAAFDAAAVAGERLDPDNAYFPLLRAAGLFAARRDDEALAAVHRAGEKPAWREYIQDEVDGRWRLTRTVLGPYEAGALGRATTAASILFPQYAQMRAVARTATYQAVLAEQGGRTEEGFAIRRALARCGSRMRSDSTNLIGSLVGIAIANVAATRPGGGPPEPRDRDMQNQTKDEQHSRERQAAYLAYLEKIGHADEARWTETEFAAGWQVRAVWQKGLHRSILGAPVLNLAAWWEWNLFTLINLFYVLVLGALAGLLARTYWARSGSSLPVAIRRGTAIGVGGAALVGLGMAQPLADDPELATAVSFAAVLLLAAGVLLFGTALLRQQRTGSAGKRGWGVRTGLTAALTAFVVALLTGTLVGALARGPHALLQIVTALRGLTPSDESGTTNSVLHLPSPPLITLATVTVPLALVLLLGVASRIARVPFLAGLVRGLRGLALPVACGLVLVYGLLVLGTVRQEARVSEGLRQTLAHEGRYLARLTGESWPD